MNIEEIKESIARTVEIHGTWFVSWSVEVDKGCMMEAFKLAHAQWPHAKIKTFYIDDRQAIQAILMPTPEVKHDGTHLRISTIEVDDPFEAMKQAGIEYTLTVGQPIGDQVWFMDCTNVPDTLPEWAEIFEISKELFDQYFTK